ncbi:hypothetical protein C6497_00785 [Candidatus Poribacteria bacterium]|nr:MAG: hypothetical protein C6497_00785 [Candidatus Poribacteria bacterium]
MMIIYKNDPKYNILITSKNQHFITTKNVKIKNENKNTKSLFLEILIKSIQSGVKSVYDRRHSGNLRQFQSYRM